MTQEPLTSTVAHGHTGHDAVQAVMQFVRALKYRKTWVLGALAVSCMLGALYYFTTTPKYQAQASLMISQSGPDVWNTTTAGDAGRQALIPTCERLFTRPVVLDGAIAELEKLPPAFRVDLVAQPRNRWRDILRQNLSAQSVRRTNIIDVSYVSQSPQAAEAVVRALVKSYTDFMDRNHRNVAEELVTILENERVRVERLLQEKQQRLLALKRQAGDLGLREGTDVVHPLVQRVVGINEKLLQVQHERIQLQASLAALDDAVRHRRDLRQHLISLQPTVGREMLITALGLSPQHAEVAGNIERKLFEDRARLEKLSQHLGNNNPQIVELRSTIANAERYLASYQQTVQQQAAGINDQRLGPMLIGMVQEKLAQTWQHERELAQQYEAQARQAVELNDRMAELAIAEHDLRMQRQLHDTILDRISTLDLKQNRADVWVAVVGEAVANETAVSPKLAMIVVVCVLGGLVCGCGAVYVLDLLDDRFRSPEELKSQLGVPVLAIIRKLPERGTSGIEQIQVHVAPSAVESEAFRTLRTTLAFSGDEAERIAITSSEPGDGKTTVLANLAASFAQAGKRTLLVDADMRRPGLSKMLDLRGRDGLSQVLRADETVERMAAARIIASGIDRLDVLPCGPKPPNPGELLSGSRMVDFIAWAETHYDQLLIDCPPMLAASDAAIVGRLVDGVLLVVQPEKNHRRIVLRAAENLFAMQVPLLGIVANRIGNEQDSGYYGYGGYGYGYGYGYGHGYGADVEDELPATITTIPSVTPVTTDPRKRHSPEAEERSSGDRIVPRRAA